MSDDFSLSGTSGRSGVTLNLFRGCLVATLPADLSGDTLSFFRHDLLDQLAKARAKRVVFDCAGLELLDPEEFQALGKVASMAGLLGASVILAGLRPGIVASLITMGEDCGKLRGCERKIRQRTDRVIELLDTTRSDEGAGHPRIAQRPRDRHLCQRLTA